MMEEPLGPFAVTPTQITGLGAAFTPFVNALLRVEVAAAGLSGSLITTTYQENVGDEGVDAGLSRVVETRYIPAGDSAWQFKRGDLPPAKCKTELAGAAGALAILRAGGRYRLVLGVDINDSKVKRRRAALREEATRLGIGLADDSIEVLTASDLAEWAEKHPSLAVSQLIGGIRGSVEDFTEWAGSRGAMTTWVDSLSRQSVIAKIHQLIETDDQVALHLEGVSGLGKSRTVLESLRGRPYEALVIYVRDAETFPPSLIRHLTGAGRVAILVVDECDQKQHKSLATALPVESALKLITIGEPGPSRSETPPVALPPVEDDTMTAILQHNRPNLWPEAARFVADIAAGNVRLALVLAQAVEQEPRASAARLITPDIIKTYVTEALPSGTGFSAGCALALFSRIGFDSEPAGELRLVTTALDLDLGEVRAAARTLTDLGLLTPKGQFRSVAPQPLAVYLAARAWEDFETPIIARLMPALDIYLTERLLQRAAEIGPSAPVRRAVYALLDRSDVFGSLAALVGGGFSHTLTQLAILAPGQVSDLLGQIIADATDDELQAATTVRRDLVWTLEKLAWHAETFEPAADALLRLAINETENFGNSASGTWLSLFLVMLPSTAADPKIRLAYLTRVSSSADTRVRMLATKAAVGGLQLHETAMASAERQGGVVVAPRGRPATYGDVWQYQRAAIRLVRQLVDDPDVAIAGAALSALVTAIHPFLEYEAVRGDLFDALGSLPDEGLRRVRTEVTHLQGLFNRVSGVEDRQAGLDILVAGLPAPSSPDELRALAHSKRWDLEEGELQRRITDAARAVLAEVDNQALLDLLAEELPAAFELGRALADLAAGGEIFEALTPLATGPNSAALAGYLWGLVESGDKAAFDAFLDSEVGLDLAPLVRLRLTVRGPKSDVGWRRVEELTAELPVRQAANGLFGWHVNVEIDHLATLLASWIDRVDDQYDYNAAVDFVAMALFQRPGWIDELDDLVVRLVDLRGQFPEIGQQNWDWTQLAKRQLDRRPFELLQSALYLIDSGELRLFSPGEETELLREACRRSGAAGWDLVMSMLTAGSWRIHMDIRGWLVDQFPADDVVAWIGADVERAKLVAAIVGTGGEAPNPVTRYLLEHFGEDGRVASSVARDFISGSWIGNESDRAASQIAQLRRWLESPSEPVGVKRWARQMIASLEHQRLAALEREAEENRS
jgi:hypothetical protein